MKTYFLLSIIFIQSIILFTGKAAKVKSNFASLVLYLVVCLCYMALLVCASAVVVCIVKWLWEV